MKTHMCVCVCVEENFRMAMVYRSVGFNLKYLLGLSVDTCHHKRFRLVRIVPSQVMYSLVLV